MPSKTDFNVDPYFDDFSVEKGYHRVLFRPSIPVQARELTQLQTILQDQIEKFGDWAFRNGDVVTGCTVTDIPVMPYVRIQDYQNNSAAFDINDLENTQVVSTSNLQARVLTVSGGTTTGYPNTNMVYIRYLNTGTGGETSFSNNETLTFLRIPQTGNAAYDNIAVINTYANTTGNTYTSGNAHGICVSEGVVYLGGFFVRVPTSSVGIVNAYGTDAANLVVGFQATEEFINEIDDDSLNDNALGYSNENAPGAHRFKITPTLLALDPDTAANTEGFNPIATYNFGALISKETPGANIYSVLGDAIERRTFEESGNYVVNPFTVDTVTTLPGNSAMGTLDANSVLGRVSPGLGYAQGARVELLKSAYINMRRGVDTKTFENQQITFNYGGYLLCSEVAGSFDFTGAATVDLYDTYQKAVTDREYSGLSPTGNLIGTAKLRQFSLLGGTPGSNTALYAVHVFDIKMSNGKNAKNIKSIHYDGTVKGVADVLSSGTVGSSNKDQFYSFGLNGLKNLRDESNDNNTSYHYRGKKSTSMYANGIVVATLGASATGGTDILPWGTGILPDATASSITLVATANVDTANLAGTVTVSSVTNVVTGSSSSFLTNFVPGSIIKVGSDLRRVTEVTNATYLRIDAAFSSNASGQNYKKSYIAGQHLPISLTANPYAPSYVNVTNTTSFTIVTSEAPSGGMNVEVIHNILRNEVSPATKTIKRDRFVKIDTRSNPKGPWCLGYPDVFQIKAVYGASSNVYTTGGTTLTASFLLDSGQRDTHYDYAYLYPKPGLDTTSNPYLLVQLDYFAANTAAGRGFFTVESYPIDDANTANVAAIQTKDIPLYIDDAGRKTWLRDYIDFRPHATPTANDTGNVVTSNSSQMTTAIGYASLNPSSNLTITVPSGGLNVPAYGQNFEADFTAYLSRKDIVLITPENKLKLKEGVSAIEPQTPLYPDNAMAIAVLNVPPYPSLSSDQLDGLLAQNKASRNLTRDTSTAISAAIVSNRRYTMRDVGVLDKRITNLEYYQALTLLEKKAADLTVLDENGLERFKNGIFVEPFSNYQLSDVANPEYRIAIDQRLGIARPFFTREMIKIEFNANSSPDTQQTGRVITLPYERVAFMTQPYATQYRSSALVAFGWNGRVRLFPPFDNAVDEVNTGSVNITVDNAAPWQEFAASPMGTTWGAWSTSSSSSSQTTSSGAVNNIVQRETINLGVVAANLIDANNDGVADFSVDQLQAIATAAGQQQASSILTGLGSTAVQGSLNITLKDAT